MVKPVAGCGECAEVGGRGKAAVLRLHVFGEDLDHGGVLDPEF
jgi:hypothetical protein